MVQSQGISSLPAPWNPQLPVLTDWHSGMSPYPYEIVLRSQFSCTVCYGGCGQPYTDRDLFVIRHMDKRVLGKDDSGKLVYNHQFKAAYYHAAFDHVQMKNIYFNGYVNMARTLAESLSTDMMSYLSNTCQLTINVIG